MLLVDKLKTLEKISKENKEHNKILREFEKRIKESGVTCAQYKKLGYQFNGLTRTHKPFSTRNHVAPEHPMLFKKVPYSKKNLIVKIILNDDEIKLPSTLQEVQDLDFDIAYEKGVKDGKFQERIFMQKKYAEFQKLFGGKAFISSNYPKNRNRKLG